MPIISRLRNRANTMKNIWAAHWLCATPVTALECSEGIMLVRFSMYPNVHPISVSPTCNHHKIIYKYKSPHHTDKKGFMSGVPYKRKFLEARVLLEQRSSDIGWGICYAIGLWDTTIVLLINSSYITYSPLWHRTANNSHWWNCVPYPFLKRDLIPGVIELVSFQQNSHNIMSRSTIILQIFCLNGWIFSSKLQKGITTMNLRISIIKYTKHLITSHLTRLFTIKCRIIMYCNNICGLTVVQFLLQWVSIVETTRVSGAFGARPRKSKV